MDEKIFDAIMDKHLPNLIKPMDTRNKETQWTSSNIKTNKEMTMALHNQISENLWKEKNLKSSGEKKAFCAQLNNDNGLTEK